jgi:hypothetical protein
MTTIDELKQLDQTEKENNELRFAQGQQDALNLYKRMGSSLLQSGKITDEEYYSGVRNQAIELGLLGAEEYPDQLPDWAKPAMSIGGAVGGSMLAVGMAPFTGGASLLLASSVGAGAGAAGAEYAYRFLQDFSSDQSIPLADWEEIEKKAGKEALVTGGLTVGIGAALPAIGAALKGAGSITNIGIGRLRGLTPEQRAAAGEKAGFLKDKFGRFMGENNLFEIELAKQAAAQGIRLPYSVVSHPTFRSLHEATSKIPLFSGPSKEANKRFVDDLTKRIVEGVKQGETPQQIKAALTNNFAINTRTGQFERLSNLGKYEKDYVTTAQVLKRADVLNKKVIRDENRLNSFVNSTIGQTGNSVFLKGFLSNSQQMGNAVKFADSASKNEFSSLLKSLENSQGVVRTGVLKKYEDVLRRTENKLIKMSGSGDVTEKYYLQFKAAKDAFYDDIGIAMRRSAPGAADDYARLVAARNSSSQSQKEFLDNANTFGYIDSFNNVVRNASSKEMASLVQALKKTSGPQIMKGDDVLPFPGLTELSMAKNMQKSAKKTASFDRIVDDLFKSSNAAKHQNFKKLVGDTQYNRLAQNEFEDIVEGSLAKFINGQADDGLEFFSKQIGLGTGKQAAQKAQRMKNIISNGKFNFDYNDLKALGEIFEVAPTIPGMNQFIQRSAALRFANGISAGGFLGAAGISGGAFALGGIPAALLSGGFMWGFNSIMAKPYIKNQFREAMKATGKDGLAKKQAFMQTMNEYLSPFYRGHAAAYNKYASAPNFPKIPVVNQSIIEAVDDELFEDIE